MIIVDLCFLSLRYEPLLESEEIRTDRAISNESLDVSRGEHEEKSLLGGDPGKTLSLYLLFDFDPKFNTSALT